MLKRMILVGLAALMMAVCSYAQDERVSFPTDYATKFKNYVSSDRLMNEDQAIRLFANDIALQGPGEDGKFANGSVLVAEVYKAKKGEDGEILESQLGRRIRGKLAAVGVMEKREGWGQSIPEKLRTGDWDFAIFSPDGKRLVKKDLNKCRECHAPHASTDHLYSYEHLKN